MQKPRRMSVELSPRERAERQVQEEAQALVARGQLVPAVRRLDAFLASHDGDWGLWLYTAGLYARLGLKGQAIAAYRACSRQLEDAGLYARARAALVVAAPLDPKDASLARDIQRLSRQLPQDPADQTCLLEAVSPPPEPPLRSAGKVTVPARPSPLRALHARPPVPEVRSPPGTRAPSPVIVATTGVRPTPGSPRAGVPAAARPSPAASAVTPRPSPRAEAPAAAPPSPAALPRSSPRAAVPPPAAPMSPAVSPRPSPSVDLRPRTGPDPFSLLAELPLVFRPSAPRLPPKGTQDPKHARTSLVRKRTPVPSTTDPYLAIFDILDAEKAARG